MAGSTLDPDNVPEGRRPKKHLKGHDTKSLGPSDSSDSGSDLAAAGTDELVGDIDRDADRVVGPEEAGLGSGLDQAEEARKKKDD